MDRPQTTFTAIDRIKAELKHSPRKIVILALLLLAGLVVGVRTVLQATPKSASAAPAAAAPAAAKAAARPKPVSRDAYLRRIDRTITRDLFAVRLELFPPEPTAEKPQTVVAATGPADEVRLVEAQARGLCLQSTVMGEHPTAIINGVVLGIGERISDFEILGIGARSCDVGKDGVRLTLRLLE